MQSGGRDGPQAPRRVCPECAERLAPQSVAHRLKFVASFRFIEEVRNREMRIRCSSHRPKALAWVYEPGLWHHCAMLPVPSKSWIRICWMNDSGYRTLKHTKDPPRNWNFQPQAKNGPLAPSWRTADPEPEVPRGGGAGLHCLGAESPFFHSGKLVPLHLP